MKFTTLDSKLEFDKYYLNIIKIKHDPIRRYWFDSFILLTLFIGLQTYQALNEKPRAWVLVIIGLTWIYPHLERIFKMLFIYKWGNRIKLEKITSASILSQDNELETTIRLILSNGRQKLLTFRTAENQINNFVEVLRQKAIHLNIETGHS